MSTKKFTPRTKAPTEDNRWYGKDNIYYGTSTDMFKSHKGIKGNCTHYTVGRFQELNNEKSKIKKESPETYIDVAKKVGYKTGSTPKLGAILVWEHKDKSGGHCGNVEHIYPNGDIDASMSGYATYFFKVRKLTKKSGYVYSDYKLLGFVYPNDEYYEDRIDIYPKGTYTIVSPRYVRTGPGTEYSIKKVSQLTADGKKNATSTKATANAQYKKGTKFTAKEVMYAKNGGIWAKTPSGYVCLESCKGTTYVKKG